MASCIYRKFNSPSKEDESGRQRIGMGSRPVKAVKHVPRIASSNAITDDTTAKLAALQRRAKALSPTAINSAWH